MGIVPARGTRDNPTPLDIRFWSKVDKRGPDECWPWIGSIGRDGYGHIWNGTLSSRGSKRLEGAHRVTLKLAGVHIPDGKCALHKNDCHHKWCVNPTHLYVGSRADNARDAIEAGTFYHVSEHQPRGQDSPHAVLNDDKVRDIRDRWSKGESQTKLAKEFGVVPSLINCVVHRKAWGHI